MKMKKIISITLVTVLFAVAFTGCKNSGGDKTDKKENVVYVEDERPEELYSIDEMDTINQVIALTSIDTGRSLRYFYSTKTDFRDSYGHISAWTNFEQGDIVKIGNMLEDSSISKVEKSDKYWSDSEIDNFSIDKELGLMMIGQAKYRLSDDTLVYANGGRSTLDQITEDDVLKVVGKDKDIITISVTTGHGAIVLRNTELFDGSFMYIGDKMITTVSEGLIVFVPEGTYPITVANDGWGGTADFTIEPGEIYEVNLDELKGSGPKYCTLYVTVPVEGAQIYIDGKKVISGVATQVKYGAHALTITASGYSTLSKTLVVNSPSAEIMLELTDAASVQTTTNPNTSVNNSTSGNSGSSSGGSSNTNSTNGSSTNSGTNSNSSSTNSNDQATYLNTISDILSTLMGS